MLTTTVFYFIFTFLIVESISIARALLTHESDNPNYLKFSSGDTIRVTSKAAGIRSDLWGGEVNGRSGYFPSHYVKDFRIYEPDPKHYVRVSQVILKVVMCFYKVTLCSASRVYKLFVLIA